MTCLRRVCPNCCIDMPGEFCRFCDSETLPVLEKTSGGGRKLGWFWFWSVVLVFAVCCFLWRFA